MPRYENESPPPTAELDQALTQAARALDPLGYKLKRTRHRGVYRSRERYIVPYVDELGGDRRREFETLGQARDFSSALRIADKAPFPPGTRHTP